MLEHSVMPVNDVAPIDNDWTLFMDTLCSVVMVREVFGREVVIADKEVARDSATK